MFIFIEGEGARFNSMVESSKKLGNFESYAEEMDYKVLYKAEALGPAAVPTPECFKNIPQTEIAMVTYCNFSKEGIDLLPNLKLIGTSRGGMEHIDLDYCTSKGIAVTNCPGHNAATVSQHAIALMLGVIDNIAICDREIRNGGWGGDYPNKSDWKLIKGQKVGIVGFGNIGQLTAHTLSGFDVEIMGYDPYVGQDVMDKFNARKVELKELFETADIVIVHARLLPESKHLVSRELINSMKPTAFLINNARSGLVDMDALYDALNEKRICAAAIDVWDQEPLPVDDRFRKLPNILLSPHTHAGGPSAFQYTTNMCADGILAALHCDLSSRQLRNPEVVKTPEFQAWAKKACEELGI